jgi:hypothetical protein
MHIRQSGNNSKLIYIFICIKHFHACTLIALHFHMKQCHLCSSVQNILISL